MTLLSAKWIFWGGTLASVAVFGVLTFDTHRQLDALTHAERLDDTVVAGKTAFERHNCNECHTILGFGGYYAPDLTRAGFLPVQAGSLGSAAPPPPRLEPGSAVGVKLVRGNVDQAAGV